MLKPSACLSFFRSKIQSLHIKYFIRFYSDSELNALVEKNKVVAFIKGTEEQPMCGFSLSVVRILQLHTNEGVSFVNILEDEELRQEMKKFSNWPTFPQVYMNRKFIGGYDIMLELHKNGELVKMLEEIGIKSLLKDQYEQH